MGKSYKRNDERNSSKRWTKEAQRARDEAAKKKPAYEESSCEPNEKDMAYPYDASHIPVWD